MATLFLVEEATLAKINGLLIAQVDADSLRDAQRHIAAWINAALKAKGAPFPHQSMNSLLEFRAMFEDNIDRWILEQQGREEGLEQRGEEGVALATRTHLSKLLNLMFGPREGREAELEVRPLAELELALERILLADREEEL